MPRIINIDPETLAANGDLTSFEVDLATYFMELGDAFNIPRSLPLIYTVIFSAPEPVCFEEVQQKTGLSKSRVSDGLKTLLGSGFIQDVYYQMNRRTFYQPEGSLRGWFTDLVKDKVRPQIKANGTKIQDLKESYLQGGGADELITARLDSLMTWNRKPQRVLPMITKVIGLTGKVPKRQSKTLPTRGKILSREEVGK